MALIYITIFSKGYTVSIRQMGSQSRASDLDNEENNYSISFDYDWQNKKVTVQLKFLYEGCYHATIKYNDTELHNGDFDIIVLNSTVMSYWNRLFSNSAFLKVWMQHWSTKTWLPRTIMFLTRRN